MRNSFSVFTIFRTYKYLLWQKLLVNEPSITTYAWMICLFTQRSLPLIDGSRFTPFYPRPGYFFTPPPSFLWCRNGALSSEISFGLMLCFSRNFSPGLRVGWANKPLGKYYYNTRVIFCTTNYLSVSATSAYDIYRLRNRNWVSDIILFKLTNQFFYL